VPVSAPQASGLPTVGSSLPVAIVVGLVLFGLGVLIARRVARGDLFAGLAGVMIASVALHLVCAPAQIYVVDHFYGGVADWLRYDHQGSLLADNVRNGHLTFAGTGIHRLLGDGAVSIAGAVIMTVVGPDQLAAFFVSAWLAFVGTVFFYKAFAITFPNSNRRRYALLVFLFPSLLFWTADVSKESIMLFALGLTAYGMAQILTRKGIGYLWALLGGALAVVVRPDELAILVVAFAIAMVVRAVTRTPASKRNLLGTTFAFVFVTAAVLITAFVTAHFVHNLTGSGITNALSKVSSNNQGTGAGFGSSSVAYSTNPLWYPRDIYTVLFDPLPFSAHSTTQIFAALENTLILVVILLSFRQLRSVPRACLRRPYVLAALLYSAAFVYAFAALGNLGLITRERTLVLPLLFVLLAVPLAARGASPYPWQRPKRDERPREPRAPGPAGRESLGARAEWAATASSERMPEPAAVGVAEWGHSEWVSEPYRTE
jgi:hypothetical protein